MRVGADKRVGIGNTVVAHHHAPGEVFHVDLMADAEARRKHAQLFEGLLAPLEKFIALLVAFKFPRNVDAERFCVARVVELDGMVDHQIDGNKRLDLSRILTGLFHGGAQRGEINHAGNTGKIL